MSTPTFHIRQAVHEDLARITEIENESFSNPWPPVLFRGELERPSPGGIWVAENSDGLVVGFIVLRELWEEMEVLDVAVCHIMRNRGLGRLLMNYAIDMARAHGMTQLILEVRESNESARHLYESLGFEWVGKRDYYYTQPVEHAILYAKPLKSKLE